jgi:hypothetical protein
MPFIQATPYEFPFGGKFDKEHTALVIIDMQNDCTIYPFDQA